MVYDPATNQWSSSYIRGKCPLMESKLAVLGSNLICIGTDNSSGDIKVSVLSSADKWVQLPIKLDLYMHQEQMTGVFAETLDDCSTTLVADVDISTIAGHEPFEHFKNSLAGFVSTHLELNSAASGTVVFKRTAMIGQPATVGSNSLTLLPHQLLVHQHLVGVTMILPTGF